jgi:hypothetical protein
MGLLCHFSGGEHQSERVRLQGGATGIFVTLGGRFGGYGLYLLKGKPVFLYNFLDLERFRWDSQQALAPGSTPSCSTSNKMALDSAKAALAS